MFRIQPLNLLLESWVRDQRARARQGIPLRHLTLTTSGALRRTLLEVCRSAGGAAGAEVRTLMGWARAECARAESTRELPASLAWPLLERCGLIAADGSGAPWDAVLRGVRDLRDSGALECPALERVAAPRLRRLIAGARSFERVLIEAELRDEPLCLLRAAELSREPAPGGLSLFGFADLTGRQQALLVALIRAARASGVAVHAYVPLVALPGGEGDLPVAVQLLRRELGAEQRNDGEECSPAEVEVISVAGRRVLEREALAEVVRAIRAGVPPAEISVVFRGTPPQSFLERVQQLGIPLRAPPGSTLAQRPEGLVLRTFLEWDGGELRRATLADLLGVVPIHPELCPQPIEERVRAHLSSELILRRVSRLAPGEIPAAQPPTGEDPRASAALEPLRRALLAWLAGALEGLRRARAAATLEEMGARLARIFDVSAWALDPCDLLAEAGEWLEAIGARGESPRARERFLMDFISDYSLESPGVNRGGLEVLSAAAARGTRSRIRILAGASHGEYPLGGAAPTPLGEADRELLEARGGGVVRLALRSRRLAEERALFRLATAGASERLVLLYERLTFPEGRESYPSTFVLELVGAAQGRVLEAGDLEDLPCHRRVGRLRRSSSEPWLDECEWNQERIRTALERGQEEIFAFLEESFAEVLPRAFALERARWGSRRYTSYDGCLGDRRLHAILPARGARAQAPMAVRHLIQWLSCPMQFLLEHGFGLRPLEEPEAVNLPAAREEGSLLHAVLERFISERIDAGELPLGSHSVDALRRSLGGILDAQIEQLRTDGLEAALASALTASLRNILEDWLDRQLLAEDAFEPLAVEWDLPQPFALECASREIYLRGRADRLDRRGVGESAEFRVVDYKCSRRVLSSARAGKLRPEHLQVALYAEALTRHPMAAGARLVQGVFDYICLGTSRDCAAQRDLDGSESMIADGIDALRAGAAVQCFEERRCRNCSFRIACGGALEDLLLSKAGDEAIPAHFRMVDR